MAVDWPTPWQYWAQIEKASSKRTLGIRNLGPVAAFT